MMFILVTVRLVYRLIIACNGLSFAIIVSHILFRSVLGEFTALLQLHVDHMIIINLTVSFSFTIWKRLLKKFSSTFSSRNRYLVLYV